MSDEKSLAPLSDPGLPAHKYRKSDIDQKAAKRAEQQVAILFLLSAIGTLLVVYSYIFIPVDSFIFLPIMGEQNAHQLFLGLGLAMALFFIGAGAVHAAGRGAAVGAGSSSDGAHDVWESALGGTALLGGMGLSSAGTAETGGTAPRSSRSGLGMVSVMVLLCQSDSERAVRGRRPVRRPHRAWAR